MKPIETYVFFDLETTGLKTEKDGVPGITELGMLAVKRRHLLATKPDKEPRVQYKIRMCFNPNKQMSEKSMKLSGLSNQMLEQEAELNIDAFNAINSFINCLQRPVCLIAHDGYRYHFPVLKYYFEKMNVHLASDIKCSDSLLAFYELIEAEKHGNVSQLSSSNQSTQKKSFSQLARNPYYAPNEYPGEPYKLNDIYRRVTDSAHLETNRAENQCIMILKIALSRAERFVEWIEDNHCDFSEVPCLTDALNAWKMTCPNTDLPSNPYPQSQWDGPLCIIIRNSLINTSLSTAERTRLLAEGEWESGLWLRALPSSTIGTMLDDGSFRLATCLRLGVPCVAPLPCHCDEVVDSLGHHGLSCHGSAGRIARHASVNDIIHRALATAGIPAVLEPNGLVCDDGKRPDGMTLLPWKMGRPLVWDATCVNTLARSHLSSMAGYAGAAAAATETLKRRNKRKQTSA